MTNIILFALYLTGVFYFWRARLRAGSPNGPLYTAIMAAIIGIAWPSTAIMVVSENFTKMYRN